MVSVKLRSRDIGMEREERDRGTRREIHKMDNRYRLQNARLYNQGAITEIEAERKSKGKSFKVRRKIEKWKGKQNSKKVRGVNKGNKIARKCEKEIRKSR